MFSLERLSSGGAYPYLALVFQSMRSSLNELKPDGPFVAVGARIDGEPAGLALGQIGVEGGCDVRSLFVSRPYRGSGLGTALLSAIESELRNEGQQTVQISYLADRPTTPALERVLEKRHWGTPQAKMLICRTDEHIMEWEWYRRAEHPAPGFEIFSWIEITNEDRRSILDRQQASNWIPDDLVPFQYEKDLEPINSIGVRYKGEPAGWVITHRAAPDTIRYTCSFIRKDLQRRFHIGPLYREAYARQAKAGIPFVIWLVPAQHTAMVRFVKNRWGGGFASMNESKSASKSLIDVSRESSGAGNGR
ncbi:MAG: GNAT family N-acetyltransferase [Bryobacteraceae bacterium]